MARNNKKKWTKESILGLDSTNSYYVNFHSNTVKYKKKQNKEFVETAFVRKWDLEFYLANNVSVEILAEPINEV